MTGPNQTIRPTSSDRPRTTQPERIGLDPTSTQHELREFYQQFSTQVPGSLPSELP